MILEHSCWIGHTLIPERVVRSGEKIKYFASQSSMLQVVCAWSMSVSFRRYFPEKISTWKRTSVGEFHDESPEIPGSPFSLFSRRNILLSVWDDSGACVPAVSHHLL